MNDDPLIARKTETSDNVIPASNSSMARALYRLGLILDKKDYIQQAKRALNNMKENLVGYPDYYSNWAILMDWFIAEPYEVAISGDNAGKLNNELNKHFLPNCIFIGSQGKSDLPLLQEKFKTRETLIYVCRNKTCGLPVKSAENAWREINGDN